jgi:hypothetical protein
MACGIRIWWVKPTAEEKARQHREAMERWASFVKGGVVGQGCLKLDQHGKEVADTFEVCFRKGDNAAEYEHLLSTALKTVYPGVGVTYRWKWDGGVHAKPGRWFFFSVHVYENPTIIWMVMIDVTERPE